MHNILYNIESYVVHYDIGKDIMKTLLEII